MIRQGNDAVQQRRNITSPVNLISAMFSSTSHRVPPPATSTPLVHHSSLCTRTNPPPQPSPPSSSRRILTSSSGSTTIGSSTSTAGGSDPRPTDMWVTVTPAPSSPTSMMLTCLLSRWPGPPSAETSPGSCGAERGGGGGSGHRRAQGEVTADFLTD